LVDALRPAAEEKESKKYPHPDNSHNGCFNKQDRAGGSFSSQSTPDRFHIAGLLKVFPAFTAALFVKDRVPLPVDKEQPA